MEVKNVVCYVCGYNDFNADDIKSTQVEKTINDHECNHIAYTVCPGCGFTIEV